MSMGISFKEVKHSYKGLKKNEYVAALNGINLDIKATDEIVAIVGKTGSGKSTLALHMNALLLPTSGNVEIFEHVITPKKNKNGKLKPIRKRIGYVFQFPEYQLFEETSLKDIMFAPLNFGYNKEEAEEKALEAAKTLGISETILNKSPFNLSGGQMRKVAIAGVLAYDPDILLLDEPTRGLDPKTCNEVMEIFKDIHDKTKKTLVIITHDMNLVYQYATRVVALNEGNIIFDGTPLALFSSDIYQRAHLTKPDVLKMTDYLNESMNLNLDYSNRTIDELFLAIKEKC